MLSLIAIMILTMAPSIIQNSSAKVSKRVDELVKGGAMNKLKSQNFVCEVTERMCNRDKEVASLHRTTHILKRLCNVMMRRP
ncbi:hypothetical protein ERO13_D04G110650v2 [Gossypium hirsutum]|uniref:Uncharacterized protein n=1 Tax=Gossypium darwinii TaxID=34276 RepID=A0A5D2D0Q6_GOSDA|nr:hypothetical protein ERO13_D04G110650v2 [Gossypium hirsutum]TYG73856.1 hypothetical protein ES288_D04G135400v1 [Gossypium darwinii]